MTKTVRAVSRVEKEIADATQLLTAAERLSVLEDLCELIRDLINAANTDPQENEHDDDV